MDANKRRAEQKQMARMAIAGPLFLRGWSYRRIAEEVAARLDLKTYSHTTARLDVDRFLAIETEKNKRNRDKYTDIACARLDIMESELWDAWSKSMEDNVKKQRKKRVAKGDDDSDGASSFIEQSESDVTGLGNPAYIAEIRQCEEMRNKILGIYSAEKREITFAEKEKSREELLEELHRLEALDEE